MSDFPIGAIYKFTLQILYLPSLPLFPVFHGHRCCKLKTVFTGYHTVCSKGCLLMSEPMKHGAGGERDEVRAASHAPRP